MLLNKKSKTEFPQADQGSPFIRLTVPGAIQGELGALPPVHPKGHPALCRGEDSSDRALGPLPVCCTPYLLRATAWSENVVCTSSLKIHLRIFTQVSKCCGAKP
jgi:hypothetical protein